MAPYQRQSFQGLCVTVDFRIAIKEILDHLRSALDYCAREISERCSGSPLPPDSKVYFPIVGKAFNPDDFRSVVGKQVPGVLGSREDLVAVFASFQEFSSSSNAWLPDFATLCNENKHERLSLQQVMKCLAEVSEHQGTPVYTIHRKDKTPMEDGFLTVFFPDPSKPNKRVAAYFRFEAIDYEVNSFLQLAINGVESIIKELMAKV
jgi:hypothetical protein